jgi:hypothetical protein
MTQARKPGQSGAPARYPRPAKSMRLAFPDPIPTTRPSSARNRKGTSNGARPMGSRPIFQDAGHSQRQRATAAAVVGDRMVASGPLRTPVGRKHEGSARPRQRPATTPQCCHRLPHPYCRRRTETARAGHGPEHHAVGRRVTHRRPLSCVQLDSYEDSAPLRHRKSNALDASRSPLHCTLGECLPIRVCCMGSAPQLTSSEACRPDLSNARIGALSLHRDHGRASDELGTRQGCGLPLRPIATASAARTASTVSPAGAPRLRSQMHVTRVKRDLPTPRPEPCSSPQAGAAARLLHPSNLSSLGVRAR